MKKHVPTVLFLFLFLILLSCSQDQREYLIEGTIIKINEKTGEIDIKGTMVVTKSPRNPERVGVKLGSEVQHILVSNPKKYLLGQQVKVKVISDYGKDSWDLNSLDFEVELIK